MLAIHASNAAFSGEVFVFEILTIGAKNYTAECVHSAVDRDRPFFTDVRNYSPPSDFPARTYTVLVTFDVSQILRSSKDRQSTAPELVGHARKESTLYGT